MPVRKFFVKTIWLRLADRQGFDAAGIARTVGLETQSVSIRVLGLFGPGQQRRRGQHNSHRYVRIDSEWPHTQRPDWRAAG